MARKSFVLLNFLKHSLSLAFVFFPKNKFQFSPFLRILDRCSFSLRKIKMAKINKALYAQIINYKIIFVLMNICVKLLIPAKKDRFE